MLAVVGAVAVVGALVSQFGRDGLTGGLVLIAVVSFGLMGVAGRVERGST